MIRLVLADDHAIMRSGLKQIFNMVPDFEVVGEAANGDEVIGLLRKDPFDLLLLDLNMPGVKGPELIAKIRVHHPSLPILVLSMHHEPQIASRALKAGATGYITKDSELPVLLAAIRKVANNGRYISPTIAEKMALEATAVSPQLRSGPLTERELQVFRLLAQGSSVNEIAAQLNISNKTVSTHKVRLMEKMKLTSLADLIRVDIQEGDQLDFVVTLG